VSFYSYPWHPEWTLDLGGVEQVTGKWAVWRP
jgi:hypothetical protein